MTPAPAMLACGTTKITNRKLSNAPRGTAGCLLRSANGGPPSYLLTAGHVLAPEGFEGAVGDPVSDDDGNLIGHLAAATKPSIDGVDAAIVELQVSADPSQGSLGMPTGWVGVVGPGMMLRCVGATSGELSTTVLEPEASLPVRYPLPFGDPMIVTLRSHIACDDVFENGDSGAAVLNPWSQLAGIVIAASDSDQDQVVVAPIMTILDALRKQGFDLQPVVDDTVTVPPAAGAPPAAVDVPATAEGLAPAAQGAQPPILPQPANPPWSGAIFLGSPTVDQGSDPVDVLAWTLWAEAAIDYEKARDEQGLPLLDKAYRAVAEVVVNRVRRPGWWGKSIQTVCLCHNDQQVYQFSCWAPGASKSIRSDAVRASTSFLAASWVARHVVDGWSGNLVAGACNYFADYLNPSPAWARNHKPCAKIGHHLFFNDIP